MEHTQQYEAEHLGKVKDKLAAEIKELNAQLGDKQEEIVRMKKYFWENCNEFDEFGYEHYTNRQMIQNEIDMAEDHEMIEGLSLDPMDLPSLPRHVPIIMHPTNRFRRKSSLKFLSIWKNLKQSPAKSSEIRRILCSAP